VSRGGLDHDDDFERLLDDYLSPPAEPNPDMANVEIVWVHDNADYGARHMAEKHGVTIREVEEVLLQIPPHVEARRNREYPDRTVFWGATRHDRWLVVVCEDWKKDGKRFLKPITAFEPDDGEEYWRRQ
jgi:uncharacterized DUF497 family protein